MTRRTTAQIIASRMHETIETLDAPAAGPVDAFVQRVVEAGVPALERWLGVWSRAVSRFGPVHHAWALERRRFALDGACTYGLPYWMEIVLKNALETGGHDPQE